MTISLDRFTVVVTGGAKRLGRAIALQCAQSGADVAITYRSSRDEALATVAELEHLAPRQKFAAYEADLSQSLDVHRLIDTLWHDFGQVTALVNNAAIFRRTPWEELSEADFDAHIESNLKAPFLTSKAFGDRFLAQNEGHIVNFADIYAQRPLANYIPYCLSKSGVVMLTQGMAKALAPKVRVNCICPGTILPPPDTEDVAGAEADLVKRVPFGRLGTPEEIAQTVVFLLGGPAFITGAMITVDGGQSLR